MKNLKKSFILIGFQASGKTTLGKKLAHQLQYPFIDTDQLIEQFHPTLSCREIFQLFGQSYFRDLESQVIHSLPLTHHSPFVLASGGGSLMEENNGRILKNHGILFYLKTPISILKERIWKQSSLPAFLKKEDACQDLITLYHERCVLYEKWADQMIEIDQINEEEALTKILDSIKEINLSIYKV